MLTEIKMPFVAGERRRTWLRCNNLRDTLPETCKRQRRIFFGVRAPFSRYSPRVQRTASEQVSVHRSTSELRSSAADPGPVLPHGRSDGARVRDQVVSRCFKRRIPTATVPALNPQLGYWRQAMFCVASWIAYHSAADHE